jgi:transcriptional regulator with XRE-family HTH domain
VKIVGKVTRLFYLRKESGFTQRAFERIIGIPHALYAMLEQGRVNKPYPYMKQKLEEYFKRPFAELMQLIDVEDSYKSGGNLSMSDRGRKGGSTVLLKYGTEHFKKMRRKQETENGDK